MISLSSIQSLFSFVNASLKTKSDRLDASTYDQRFYCANYSIESGSIRSLSTSAISL